MARSSAISHDPLVEAVIRRGGASRDPLAIYGLWGSSAPLLAATLAQRTGRAMLYIAAHAEQADEAADDLETFLERRPEVFPAWELRPGEGAARDEIAGERARVCGWLHQETTHAEREARTGVSGAAGVIVAPIQALMQPAPTPEVLARNALALKVGQVRAPNDIAAWLAEHDFTRLDQVEQPGDFALRGGILDIFISAAVDPVRIEFFGDQIESIRQFEVGTQRSTRDLKETRISLPPRQSEAELRPEETTSLLRYLPRDAVVVVHEAPETAEMGRILLDRLGNPVNMYPADAVFRLAQEFSLLYLSRFDHSAAPAENTFAARTDSLPPFDTKAADAVLQLIELSRGTPATVYCDNEGERQRLRELIEQNEAAASGAAQSQIELAIGWIKQGFVWKKSDEEKAQRHEGTKGRRDAATDLKSEISNLQSEISNLQSSQPSALSPQSSALGPAIAFVGHHELFHRYVRRRRIRRVAASRPIESFLDLETGDYVVHATHGIARYAGLKTIRKGERGKTEEFLALQFADEAILHVPSSQIDLVQKYVGPGTARPPLSKLGGTRWKTAKAQVEEAVTDFAAELLRVQAERDAREGIAYPGDTDWQREFESAFPYTETPDQSKAVDAIKRDMTTPRPMDRLLCGDVGYGKTELAMRAAFKAIEYGRQVAVLVPTTVLAEQHYRTFSERMAEYPFVVERMSRFRSRRQQTDILARTRKGQVDVLIGTHRILSRDVKFADLGLVVIDEEQRFGVEHKERIKHLRTEIDVLTLTATPIPRTLHMAMVGLRDISALETPPLDRRSIQTQVVNWSDALIRDAILREMNRDGQVFFVHNRVQSIQKIADRLAVIVPEARLLIGHGQMDGDELEDVMTRFVRGEADVLVSTAIIESGIDIPTANTMIIDRADYFGLADLHQLRGRVGRYKHRAYCYLLLPPDRPLTSTAAKRLKAIEEFSELGSGFRIAMRDLEIRGAGNILGPEQSGHISAVGYEMYCKLLENAVRRMKGQPPDVAPEVHLELDLEAYVPKSFVPSDRQRMEIYRRITACRTAADLEQIERDIRDVWGDPPPQLRTLLDLADLRVRALPWKVRSVIRKEPDFIFRVDDIRLADRMFAGSSGSVRVVDAQTLHWRVPEKYFAPPTMLAVLRRLFSQPLDHVQPPAAETERTRRPGPRKERARG